MELLTLNSKVKYLLQGVLYWHLPYCNRYRRHQTLRGRLGGRPVQASPAGEGAGRRAGGQAAHDAQTLQPVVAQAAEKARFAHAEDEAARPQGHCSVAEA